MIHISTERKKDGAFGGTHVELAGEGAQLLAELAFLVRELISNEFPEEAIDIAVKLGKDKKLGVVSESEEVRKELS